MQRLEVSGAVRPIYGSLGVKRLIFPSLTHYGRCLSKLQVQRKVMNWYVVSCAAVEHLCVVRLWNICVLCAAVEHLCVVCGRGTFVCCVRLWNICVLCAAVEHLSSVWFSRRT